MTSIVARVIVIYSPQIKRSLVFISRYLEFEIFYTILVIKSSLLLSSDVKSHLLLNLMF